MNENYKLDQNYGTLVADLHFTKNQALFSRFGRPISINSTG